MSYFVLENSKGPAWDHSRGRRQQDGWEEHAAFMDALVDDGLIVMGGPIGEVEGELTLLVFEADDEETIRSRMAEDPWHDQMLEIASLRPWHVWLRSR